MIKFAATQLLRAFLFFTLLPAGFVASQDTPPPVDADILLKGGTLYLGDGKAPITGDLAIKGDQIVAVGRFTTGQVKQELDCSGLVITPGFIDLHNHSDTPIQQPNTRACMNYVTQGCTTIVTGNCGSGPVDVESYYAKLTTRGIGINVAHLIPQRSLRREVIGNERRAASDAELDAMRALVDKGMKDGAWGMSTGLIYVPSSYADEAELTELSKVVGTHGGIYVSHMRNEGVDLLDAVDEAVNIGRNANVAIHLSHFKSSGKNSWGLVRIAVDRIEQLREEGMKITADQYPYTASSTSLGATVIPAWARAGGAQERLARFDDPEEGPRVRQAMADKLVILDGGQRLQIASYSPRPEWAGMRLSEIAASEKKTPLEMVIEMERAGGAAIVNHSINEEDVRVVMKRPWVATASDGGAKLPNATVPHPRNYGTFPRKIGYYSIREGVLPLEQAIRSSTGLPADILGLPDRGYLKRNMKADIAIWDPDSFIDTATFEQPHQYSSGLSFLITNGVFVISNGTPTGALAGRTLIRQNNTE